jgi:hypothetical protein
MANKKRGGRAAPIHIFRSFTHSHICYRKIKAPITSTILGKSSVNYVANAYGKEPYGLSSSSSESLKDPSLCMI